MKRTVLLVLLCLALAGPGCTLRVVDFKALSTRIIFPLRIEQAVDEFLAQGLESPDGAILALPVGDTLKRADVKLEIAATVDRRGLWAAQTPQLFRVGVLADAIDVAQQEGCKLTDEASAMEFVGIKPLLVMGSSANIKITHSSDLAIAEALLARKEQSS